MYHIFTLQITTNNNLNNKISHKQTNNKDVITLIKNALKGDSSENVFQNSSLMTETEYVYGLRSEFMASNINFMMTKSVVFAFLITILVIPKLIHLVKAKRIGDKPNERSSHKAITPTGRRNSQ